ncbi:hypothetical protein GEV38_04025 [Pseudomonas sp. 13159349]|nr:hypothetical protein GEV38_04025 [Pseudomonas sp. 13159349]
MQCKRLVKRGAISQDAWLIYARRIPRTLTQLSAQGAVVRELQFLRLVLCAELAVAECWHPATFQFAL